MSDVRCPYCGNDAERVGGKAIYPHRPDLFQRTFYRCAPCGARVGTHANSGEPLGTLANDELRRMRSEAHKLFDPIWKQGRMNRRDAYKWLSGELRISFDDCHIGSFDEGLCARAISACRRLGGGSSLENSK